MPNRLADATSPYLLQHKDNPVDWQPWGDDAFAEARRRDVPVLLSVGYAACHWCHVMAHESFEDPGTARLMNNSFVNVKVDREERPDVDAVYMEAVQAMTGHGGWPMTAFLTPTGEPFFCGTYFPPTDRMGMPSFRRVLESVAAAWRDRRDELLAAGREVVQRLAELEPGPGTGQRVDDDVLAAAASALRADYDDTAGGFGGAPKFPPSMVLEFLLRHAARTGAPEWLQMVRHTCERMARGGIYDQLGGGFARYSVDAHWVVPHFEKMLYDNALLVRVYLHLHRADRSPWSRRVVEETAEFLLRDLRTDEGGFAASLDADSEGEEGRYYVWTPDQLVTALGAADGAFAAQAFAVTADGTFEAGRSVLQLPVDPEDRPRFLDLRRRLLSARAGRVAPARDDKVVTAWNGLAVAALAEAGGLLDRSDLVVAAERAATVVVETHLRDGRLVRTSRGGVAGTAAGVLEDYGDLAEGLLTLHQVSGEPRWLSVAGALLDSALELFAAADGGFFDTAADAERLVRRPRDPTDNATPSGAAALCGALVTYAALTGSARHRDAAEAALTRVGPVLARFPRFAGWSAAVAEAVLAGPAEVAVVGAADARRGLERTARWGTAPGAVVVAGEEGEDRTPLLADRRTVGGRPAAYVCRRFVCAAPTTDPGVLADQLGAKV